MNASLDSKAPSEALLRILAGVPVSSTVLDLACGAGRHTAALLRLGFPVHACDPRPEAVRETRARVRELVDAETARRCVQERPLEALDTLDATFTWVVADQAEALLDSNADLGSLLEQSRRLLDPGGWLYLTVPAARAEASESPDRARSLAEGLVRFSTSDLEAPQLDVDLAESRPPRRMEENGESRIQVLYRRVDRQAP